MYTTNKIAFFALTELNGEVTARNKKKRAFNSRKHNSKIYFKIYRNLRYIDRSIQ